jgi:DinB superfamily
MALHPELQALLAAIDAAEADARSLTAGLSDTQANWQPGGGMGWSVVQCLDHLAKINHFYVGHFLPVVERAKTDGRGPFAGLHPTWFGRKFISILEPPVTQKVKAPKNVVPTSSMPLADALGAYLGSHEPYRRFVHLASDVDVNRVGARNPFFKAVRVRVATALQVPPAHDRRHLWQARQVLAAPGFPR